MASAGLAPRGFGYLTGNLAPAGINNKRQCIILRTRVGRGEIQQFGNWMGEAETTSMFSDHQ